MAERPILFSGPMVRALLEGRKTQTRRVLNPQPSEHRWQALRGHQQDVRLMELSTGLVARCSHRLSQREDEDSVQWIRCPYGQPGDRLRVRETWALEDCAADAQRVVWQADRAAAWVLPGNRLGDTYYLASNYQPARWRPSIHMFRWASRLTLEVTDVRVQRLQAISDADAEAEGCLGAPGGRHPMGDDGTEPREEFKGLWRDINGLDSWDANPWVWAISFRVVSAAR